ncbi:rod shape-determining protein MreD [uncultured Helcococcus sp.]|uniref:rod shape-determining protein MreD n=1 Tax=uncultured Helcococcus sp. TaxID=1072508 RepID=UPI00288B9997|nr:rod shape-determining protein MreD [uncultured Helcococcus sp.]
MKKSRLIIIFILNFLIDYAILSRMNISGVVPSVTIPIIVALSMFSRKEGIVYYAIFQGLVQDLAFNNVLGLTAMLYYLISYYVFNLNKANRDNFVYTYIILALSGIFASVYRLISEFLFNREFFGFDLTAFIKYNLIYILMIFVIYPFVYLVINQLYKINKRNMI